MVLQLVTWIFPEFFIKLSFSKLIWEFYNKMIAESTDSLIVFSSIVKSNIMRVSDLSLILVSSFWYSLVV